MQRTHPMQMHMQMQKKKNVPKEVVAKNKILNAQNFMNLVEGVEANKNISTIKTSFCSIS